MADFSPTTDQCRDGKGIPLFRKAAAQLVTNSHAAGQKKKEEEEEDQKLKYLGTIQINQNKLISAVQLNVDNNNIGQIKHNFKLFNTPHFNVMFTLVSELEDGYVISPQTKSPSSRDLHLVRVPYLDQAMDVAANLATLATAPYNNGEHVTHKNVDYIRISGREDLLTLGSSVSGDDNNGSSSSSSSTAGKYEESILAASVTPASHGQFYQRWCLDDLIVQVPVSGSGSVAGSVNTNINTNTDTQSQSQSQSQSQAQDPDNNSVQIYVPTYFCNGWKLFIVV